MLTRRGLLWAGAGGWLAARTHAGESEEVVAALPGKRPLIQHAFRAPNFETPLADLAPPFTRNDAFFVRYHLAIIPEVDPTQWRLQVAGASAQRPLTLSLHELRHDFTLVTVSAINQCAGNRRGLFAPRVPGVQWGNGAMGMPGGAACACAMCCDAPVSQVMPSKWCSAAPTPRCCRPRPRSSRVSPS